LSRIAAQSPDVAAMHRQAESEALLLNYYNARLPTIKVPESDTAEHAPSHALLQAVSPWLLCRYKPINVAGDGNCLMRSISHTLFGTEAAHVLLRLLCVIEVLRNRSFYDPAHADFYAPYKADVWLKLPNFTHFVTCLSTLGAYCDMLGVLAASTVVQKAIQTWWPLSARPGEISPFTKLVIGRGLTHCRRPVNIMWTVSEYKGGIPDINHFVPLLDRPCDVNDIIDCDSNSPFSATDIQPSTSGSNVSDCEEGCATDSDCSISVGDPCSDSVPLNDQLLTPIVGTPLPSGKHLPFAECVKTLLDTDNLTVLPAVPSGVKSNIFCCKHA